MGRIRSSVLVLGLMAGLLGLPRAAAEEGSQDDPCLCRDVVVTCTVNPSSVVQGNVFEVCATVRSVGAVTLEDVRLAVRGCPRASPVKGAALAITIPKLPQGESRTHCVKFVCDEPGECRISAHAVDSTRIAAAGCVCTAICRGLPALQVEMIDTALDRSAQGIFRKGEKFLYRLSIENDVGSALTPDLRITWTLPPELEFVSGRGEGSHTVAGSGQAATSSRFVLRPNQKVIFEVVCRVVSVPPRALVQTRADVVTDPDGVELALETESTTLRK